jgi:hypothetical protein
LSRGIPRSPPSDPAHAWARPTSIMRAWRTERVATSRRSAASAPIRRYRAVSRHSCPKRWLKTGPVTANRRLEGAVLQGSG